MRFSVIIPCYNCEKTLEETVESVRASGLYDFEIILIDDGSTDGTAALCDRLCEKHGEIRRLHQQNAGVSAARNRGIEEARGDYIWFVDSDDTVDAGAMAPAVSAAIEQQPDMLIFGMSFDYYHKGKMYRRETLLPPCNGGLSTDDLKENLRAFFDCNALTAVWNKFYLRSKLIGSGIHFREDMHLMEDFLFVLDALPCCKNIYCSKESVYRYRQSEDEKNAYRRLLRIYDLAEYIRPFEQSIERLGVPDGNKIIDDLYVMLLKQKMQYSKLDDIRKTVDVHNNGIRAGMNLKLDPMKIYIYNRKTLLRHRFAVKVKSTALYKELKAVRK